MASKNKARRASKGKTGSPRKRKPSPDLTTLTPLVTKTKRKRCRSQSDSTPKTKRKRRTRDGDSSKNSSSIQFKLHSSSDEEEVVGKIDAFHTFPDDGHLFNESGDVHVTSSSSGSEPDCSDEDSLMHKSGMDLYNTYKRTQSLIENFCLKHTVSLCHLGLLYTHQNVFVSDLARLVSCLCTV